MPDADFKPVWWMRSPHLQTLLPVFFRQRHKLVFSTETVELPDGDFIELYWSEKPSKKTVLILHGLEGSISSHYANGVFNQLEESGYRPVFMCFRGCSGRVNRLPRAYHSGETGDIETIVNHIQQATGRYPFAALGFSLGGNALLKWLGESGDNNPLQKAIAVSVPFKLHDAAIRLEQGVSKVYRNHLITSLKNTYRRKFSIMESPLNVEIDAITSFWDYDDLVTAPLHGFSGAQEYYDKCSSRQYLCNITIPTRIIHSSDDPFMFASTVPEENELSTSIDFLKTRYGGHVGFLTMTKYFQLQSWSEIKTVEFLDAG